MKTIIQGLFEEISNKRVQVNNPCGAYLLNNKSKLIENEKELIIKTYMDALVSMGMPDIEAAEKAESYYANIYE